MMLYSLGTRYSITYSKIFHGEGGHIMMPCYPKSIGHAQMLYTLSDSNGGLMIPGNDVHCYAMLPIHISAKSPKQCILNIRCRIMKVVNTCTCE